MCSNKKVTQKVLISLPISLFFLGLTTHAKTVASESLKEPKTIEEPISGLAKNISQENIMGSSTNSKVDNSTPIISQVEIQSTPRLDSLFNKVQDSKSQLVSQLTSVSQLSDVQPSDWSFDALQSLIERYNCLSGYPDNKFRGTRSLNRYEFAASLNACLTRISELITSSTSNLVLKSDLDKIDRLTTEFKSELTQFKGRIDKIETSINKVEANQFSTTTKLQGTVQFVIGGVLAGNNVRTKQPAPRIITFQDQVRLLLNTSFTGQDQLQQFSCS